jgi:Protein of unknown function (DUF2924)
MGRGRQSRGDGEVLLRATLQFDSVPALGETISRLVDLDANGLCLQWRNQMGGSPPAHLPRWLLLRLLAYRLQAAAVGGLDNETLRVLRQPKGQRSESTYPRPFETRIPTTRDGARLRAGALLVREWNGTLERVMVQEKGFAWNGKTYGSLSQVAKAMTGISWNGHRFFSLQTAKSNRSAMVPRRSRVGETASFDDASIPIKDGGAAFARKPSRQAAPP